MSWKRAEETEPEIYDASGVENAIIMGSVFMLIIATFIAMWADYSGILRYLIMLVSVTIVLLLPAYLLFQNSARSYIPEPEEHRVRPRGEVEEVRGIIKRAFGGYQASQVLLEDRLRQALIEKISIKKRMPTEQVRRISRTYEGALSLVGDEDLARLLSEFKTMGREKKVLFIRPSHEYQERIERTIKKMEEWK